MGHLAVKIAVMENERGWGRKIDDHMVCLSVQDALLFKKEFNSENVSETVPDWYMVAEGNPEPIDLTDSQYDHLKEKNRVWLSEIKRIGQ